MFNWFDQKEVRAFKGLFNEAHEHLRKKEFEQAVELYIGIHHTFEDLPESVKRQFEKQVDLLFRELTLFVRINEAYRIAKRGSMAAFHREMERIHDLTFDIQQEEGQKRDIEPLLAFAGQNYDFFLDVYTYKKDARHFRKHMREVKVLVEEKKTHQALKKYAELLLVYNQMAYLLPYYDRLEFYEVMKRLLYELSVQRLLGIAQERVPHRIFHTNLPVERVHMERPLPSPVYHEGDPRFDQMHDLVEGGELREAFKVYRDVTKEKLERMKEDRLKTPSLRFHKPLVEPHLDVFRKGYPFGERDPRFDPVHRFAEMGRVIPAVKEYERVSHEKIFLRKEKKIKKNLVKKVTVKLPQQQHTIFSQRYREKMEKDYEVLHGLIEKGDLSGAKRMLKALK